MRRPCVKGAPLCGGDAVSYILGESDWLTLIIYTIQSYAVKGGFQIT